MASSVLKNFHAWRLFRRGAEVDTDHVASLGLRDFLPSTKDGLHIPNQSWMVTNDFREVFGIQNLT